MFPLILVDLSSQLDVPSDGVHVQVGGGAIVAWAFRELRDKRFDDELGASLAWEALYAAVNKTIARTQVPLLFRSCFRSPELHCTHEQRTKVVLYAAVLRLVPRSRSRF